MSAPALLTADEVAAQLHKSALWVKRQARAGVITHERIGKSYGFTQDDVDAYRASIRKGGKAVAAVPGFAPRSRRRAS